MAGREQEASAEVGTGTFQVRMYRLLVVLSVALRRLATCSRGLTRDFPQLLVHALTGLPVLP